MTHKGFILIIDISGYTAYLSQSELVHAQEILETLMNTLVEHFHAPIIISRIEGDGIFAYTLENSFLQGQTLLETLEHLYNAFKFELAYIERNNTCTCQACALVPELGLKMIVHFGEFGLQHIGDKTELVGTDINLTHRLAKNTIVEQTGVKDYIFFTAAGIQELRLTDFAENSMIPHEESYPHLGTVNGFVYDLSPVWQRDLERRRVILPPEKVMLTTTMFLPVSPPIAWDYLLDPEIRRVFMGADRVITSKLDGRIKAGSKYHCVHGDVVLDQTILDWQPFEYYTVEQMLLLPAKMQGICTIMTTLEIQDGGTRVTNFFSNPTASNLLVRTILKLLRPILKKGMIEISKSIEATIQSALDESSFSETPMIKNSIPTT